MKKYAIDKVYNENKVSSKNSHGDEAIRYNAGDKAHYDVSRTLSNCGYKIITYKEPRYRLNVINQIVRIIRTYFLYFKIKDAEEILFQFPGCTSFWLIKKLKKKNVRIIFLLHDVESLREDFSISKEISLFNMANTIICHTEAMKNRLIELGVKSEFKMLYLFDYYVVNKEIYNESNWKSIVFAGNLKKSTFLNNLDKIETKVPFYLYGKGFVPTSSANILYEGVFFPENVSDIKGGWGLVWDGDSIDTCNGKIGNYLRYNSSHKISLYIVSGKPLIVWEESSLAEFVRSRKLGIVVSSIEEAASRISKMSKSDYDIFKSSILIYKDKLESGYFLKAVIEQNS